MAGMTVPLVDRPAVDGKMLAVDTLSRCERPSRTSARSGPCPVQLPLLEVDARSLVSVILGIPVAVEEQP